MRISQRQAEILAKEIIGRINKEAGEVYVSPEVIIAVEKFKAKQQALKDKVKQAEKALDDFTITLDSVVGRENVKNIKGYYNAFNVVQKIKEAKKPNAELIEEAIILRAMFASKDTMEDFITKLVKEFSPKKAKVSAK